MSRLSPNNEGFLLDPGGGGGAAGAGLGETVGTIAGTDLALTVDTNGVSIGYPKWITTAALSAATSNYAGVGETVGTIAGTDLAMTVNTDGVSVGYPKWITTAALSQNTSNYAGVGETVGTVAGTDLGLTVNTDGVSIKQANWLTTAAASNHSHGDPTLNLTNLSGTTASNSAGFTLSLSAAAGGAAGANTLGMSNIGNTSGTTGIVSATADQMIFAGGNNITLSQSLNGASGTITIIGGAAGANTMGMSNIGNTLGTTGIVSATADQMIFAGGANITLSQSLNGASGTLTISGRNPGAQGMSFWQNAVPGGTNFDNLGTLATTHGQLNVFPIDIGNAFFLGDMTVQSIYFNVSGNSNTNMGGHTQKFFFGLYTLNGSSVFSLNNSGSVSFGIASASSGTVNGGLSYSGARWLSINTTLFSTALTLSQAFYFGAYMWLSSSNSVGVTMLGDVVLQTGTRAGTFGGTTTAATTNGYLPYAGVLSVTTNAMPATINFQALQRTQSAAVFVPHMVFNNYGSLF